MSAPRTVARIFVELLATGAALALLWFAWRADLHWFARHQFAFLFGIPQVAITRAHKVRWMAFGLGLFLLLVVRPLWGWAAAKQSLGGTVGGLVRIGVAVVLALLVGEGVMRLREHKLSHPAPGAAVPPPDLVARTCDDHPRYGWLYRPSQTLSGWFDGRTIALAINAHANRAATQESEPDPTRPSILFAGESVATGQGLKYEETFPAIVAERLGAQAVNVSVLGYGTDQAYLRLVDSLPRLEHPIAVVTLFMPAMLARSLTQWRPHLELDEQGAIVMVPTIPMTRWSSRLRRFIEDEAPYWGDGFIDRSTNLARAMFRDTADRARARGAEPLFVIPHFGPGVRLDAQVEAEILHTLFDSQGIRYVVVDLDPSWVIPGDNHPDVRGAEKIATAVVAALRH